MTIAYAMNYANGPFSPNLVSSEYTGSNNSFANPQHLEQLPGVYPGSAAIDMVDHPYGGRDHPYYNSSLTSRWPCFETTPFGGLGDVSTAFAESAFSPSHAPIRSPLSTHSRASSETEPSPSLGGYSRAPSPQVSRSSYLEELSSHHRKEAASTTPSRKRGRPRLHPTSSGSAEEASEPRDTQRSSCVPHKQIERKYREGLNMEFERLRRAVPTLPQCTNANVIGATKPSKGMVLAAAIDYIGRVERERDAALDQLERLGGTFRTSKRSGSQADHGRS